MVKQSVSAKKVVLTSFFVDFIDVLIGVFVTAFTGSVVMLAELFQGISDLISSGLLIVGLKRPKNEVRKWALLSAVTMLLFASTLSFYYGLKRYLEPEEVENIVFAFFTLMFNFATNGYAFYLSVKRIGTKKNPISVFRGFKSSKYFLTKNTFVLDLMGMSAALVGLLALIIYKITGDFRFDGVGAMGIGIVLGLLSLDLIYSILKYKQNRRSPTPY